MNNYKIVVDTREQRPLWTGDKIERRKLEVGDYSIVGQETEFAIERKSLGDLFGTLGKGHKRFKRELEKALTYKYFAIVIDGLYSTALNKDFDNAYKIKMKGFVITSILFTIHVKYKIPIFFTKGRTESKRIIKELCNAYYKVYIK